MRVKRIFNTAVCREPVNQGNAKAIYFWEEGDISFEKKHYKINFRDKEVGVMERKSTQGSAHQNLILIILNGLRSPLPTSHGANITGWQGPSSQLK